MCNQRGVALLIVLVIVALLTILVTEFTYSVQIDMHRSRNAVHALQAQLLARSGVNLAEGFLMLDDEPTYDAYSEEWYRQLLEFCKGMKLDESMHVRCRVRDESGKLNINNTRGVRRRVESQQVTGDAVLRDAVRCLFNARGLDPATGAAAERQRRTVGDSGVHLVGGFWRHLWHSCGQAARLAERDDRAAVAAVAAHQHQYGSS